MNNVPKALIFTRPGATMYAPHYCRMVRDIEQVGEADGLPCYRGKAKIDGKQTTVESIGDNSPWYLWTTAFAIWHRRTDGEAVHEEDAHHYKAKVLTGETYIVATHPHPHQPRPHRRQQ